nr:MAG: structural protein [Totiviridae sp.]
MEYDIYAHITDDDPAAEILRAITLPGAKSLTWDEGQYGSYSFTSPPNMLTVERDVLLSEPPEPTKNTTPHQDATIPDEFHERENDVLPIYTTEMDWPQGREVKVHHRSGCYMMYTESLRRRTTPPEWKGGYLEALLKRARRQDILPMPWGGEFFAVWVAVLDATHRMLVNADIPLDTTDADVVAAHMPVGIPGTWVKFPKHGVEEALVQIYEDFRASQEFIGSLKPIHPNPHSPEEGPTQQVVDEAVSAATSPATESPIPIPGRGRVGRSRSLCGDSPVRSPGSPRGRTSSSPRRLWPGRGVAGQGPSSGPALTPAPFVPLPPLPPSSPYRRENVIPHPASVALPSQFRPMAYRETRPGEKRGNTRGIKPGKIMTLEEQAKALEDQYVAALGIRMATTPSDKSVLKYADPAVKSPIFAACVLKTGRHATGLRCPPIPKPVTVTPTHARRRTARPPPPDPPPPPPPPRPILTTAASDFEAVSGWVPPGGVITCGPHPLRTACPPGRLSEEDYSTLCSHERSYQAAMHLRHQTDFTDGQREALAHAVGIGTFRTDLFSSWGPAIPGFEVVDNRPSVPLQERYSVEVTNMFEGLQIDEDDVTDLEDVDIDGPLEPLRPARSRRRRPPPSQADDRSETASLAATEAADLAAQARIPDKSQRRKAHDALRALQRIKAFLRRNADDLDLLARYVMYRKPVGKLRIILERMLPWLRDPQEAMALGQLQWLASCAFNHVRAEVAGHGFLLTLPCMDILLATAPDSAWVRDLTGDGDVEANPGPVSPAPNMDGIRSLPSRAAWVRGGEKPYTSEVEGALAYAQQYAQPVTQKDASVNDIIGIPVLAIGPDGKSATRTKAQPWSTTLYPTTIREVHSPPAWGELVAYGDLDLPKNAEHVGTPGASLPPEVQSCRVIEDETPEPYQGYFIGATGLFVPVQEPAGRMTPSELEDSRFVRLYHKTSDESGTPKCTYAVREPAVVCVDREHAVHAWVVGERRLAAAALAIPAHIDKNKLSGYGAVPGSAHLQSKRLGYVITPRGNGADATLNFRHWGAPYIAIAPSFSEGTALCETEALAGLKDTFTKYQSVAVRPETTISGYVRSDLQRLANSEPPRKFSMLMPALKLGFMAWWAGYGGTNRVTDCLVTGQTQVHEPRVVVDRTSTVKRLVNATGLVAEDCGGLDNPSFPFMAGYVQGKLSFHLSRDSMPPGSQPLYIPEPVLSTHDPQVLAAYIALFAPWPWGNLSLLLQTRYVEQAAHECQSQIYSWFGTTTAIPGEVELAVILPATIPGKNKDWPGGRPPTVIQPRMGSRPVRHWLSKMPIPVNFRADITPSWVPLVDFLLSWATDFTAPGLNRLFHLVQASGLWDGVERWATDGLACFSNHSGAMEFHFVKPGKTDDMPSLIDPKTRGTINDPVPAFYRAWRDSGDRLPHIPDWAVWANWTPPSTWELPASSVLSASFIALGLYSFTDVRSVGPAAGRGPGLPFDQAAIFIAGEKRVCAWSLLHSELKVSVACMRAAANGEGALGDDTIYEGIFGVQARGARGLGGMPVAYVERCTLTPILSGPRGTPFTEYQIPPYFWEGQGVAPATGIPSRHVLPAIVPDGVLYTWLNSVPKEAAPLIVSAKPTEGSSSLADVTRNHLAPPPGMDGPFFTDPNAWPQLSLNDVAGLNEDEFWQYRLMHFLNGYKLSYYTSGVAPADAPYGGKAPAQPLRALDSWQLADRAPQPVLPHYPRMSTMWWATLDVDTRERLALLCKSDGITWKGILSDGVGARAGGLFFGTARPNQVWYSTSQRPGHYVTALQNMWGNSLRGQTADKPQEESSPVCPPPSSGSSHPSPADLRGPVDSSGGTGPA